MDLRVAQRNAGFAQNNNDPECLYQLVHILKAP
jgi:hypothetical protein